MYFSNPDLLFAGEHPTPRLGQGAFAAALQTLVREVWIVPLTSPGMFFLPFHLGAYCMIPALANEKALLYMDEMLQLGQSVHRRISRAPHGLEEAFLDIGGNRMHSGRVTEVSYKPMPDITSNDAGHG